MYLVHTFSLRKLNKDSEYRRVITKVRLKDDFIVEAYIYELNQD